MLFGATLDTRSHPVAHPRRHLMAPNHAVENDFQGPGRSEAHYGLDEHGQQDDRQRAAIRPDQAADKFQHWLVPRIANVRPSRVIFRPAVRLRSPYYRNGYF